MLGRVLNTHQQWLCRQLTQLGYEVARQVTVPDTGPDIQQAVREALLRSDFIIVTGGLGPTSDDLTRDYIARLLGRSLTLNNKVLDVIRAFYQSRNRPMLESTSVQAMVPDGACVLENPNGTAPGLAMEVAAGQFRTAANPSWLVLLPGPPRELYPMFTRDVVPLLQKAFPLSEPYHSITLKTACYGESALEEMIGHSLDALVNQGLVIGYCARVGEVEIRLSACTSQAGTLVAQAESIVRSLIPPCIFSVGEDRLEEVVIHELSRRKQTLVTAESCTGGFVSHRLTNVPGASESLLAGLVTYSNESKTNLLGVPAETIQKNGAVSESTAKAMALGARQRFQSDYALSLTGIAGPGGGTEDKPVGTVFIGLAGPKGVSVGRYLYRLERESFKQAASQQAMELLRQALLAS